MTTKIIKKILGTFLILSIQSCIDTGTILPKSMSELNIGSNNSNNNSCSRFTPKSSFVVRSIASGNNQNNDPQNEQLRGKLNVAIIDNFLHPVLDHQYSISLENGSIIPLEGNKELYRTLIDQAGKQIVLEGSSSNNSFIATQAYRNISSSINHQQHITQAQNPKVLFILVNFSDVQTTSYFNVSKGEELSNFMKDYYARNSFDQIVVNNDLDNNNKPDVATVNVSSLLSCNIDWYIQNIPALVTGYNINNYTHFAFIASKSQSYGTVCDGFNGVAYLNGNHQFIPDPWPKVVIAHEFGHNLGLLHASRDLNGNGQIDGTSYEVYGDHSCIMGNDFSGGVPHINATNTTQLGLLDTHNFAVQEVSQNGVYHLSPLADEKDSDDVKIIKLMGLGKNYQLAYRAKIGEDTDLKTAFVGLNLYEGKIFQNGTGYGATGSFNHKTLTAAGSTYTDSSTGVKLTLQSMNNKFAEVKIEFTGAGQGNSNCFRNPAELTIVKIEGKSEDSFEAYINIQNNDVACDVGNYNISVASEDFELESSLADLAIGSGANISAIVPLKLKVQSNDKVVLKGHINISLQGKMVNSKKFEVNFNKDC